MDLIDAIIMELGYIPDVDIMSGNVPNRFSGDGWTCWYALLDDSLLGLYVATNGAHYMTEINLCDPNSLEAIREWLSENTKVLK